MREILHVLVSLSILIQQTTVFGHTISTWEWKIFDFNDSLVYSNLDSSSIDFCDTKSNCDSSTISFDYNVMLTLTDTYGCVNSTREKLLQFIVNQLTILVLVEFVLIHLMGNKIL